MIGLPNVVIDSSSAATEDKSLPPLPPHCVVRGKANQRVGADGKPYAIRFEMRLPTDWNGRFLHQVNGGNEGVVVPALGDARNLQATGYNPAVARGFAVLSSDGGHTDKDPTNADKGLTAGSAFGLDPQARRDYGYASDTTMAAVGKAVIAKFYGAGPQRSYMFGCSNGGRHAMVTASRTPEQYDGYVAIAPGFNLPKAAVQHAWDVQSFRTINPDIRKSFSAADMTLVANGVLKACDRLDGLADGLVSDVRACQKTFDLSSLQCAGDKTDQCLSPTQVTALKRAFAGPVNRKGEALYSDWSFDGGMGAKNWRGWKVEGIPAWDGYPVIAVMGAASLSHIFTTPPTPVAGTPTALVDFLANFDFDRDAPKIHAKGSATIDGRRIDYTESAMEFMTPPDAANPTLAGLKAAGGKMIVVHGQSDAVFSINDTARWYEALNANTNGDAAAFARFFAVPGMSHCRGGPATDTFDALAAIVDWAERGKAPDRIIATVSEKNDELPADWSKTRTRPLCVWPKVPRYVGGDPETAESFDCQ
ncbi:tannase/feruloyl esterase family alpha/beta hydrolase [Azospirillum griseum]|uniref:Tannase/feruloyl esterase family alpha/beta hydrolase n=2 Tax=Azospirillum griseum TaxID=2496639 RepID=A0A3S0IE68_9PROT|nr:tannase/feruloyl esterase family alpha/beta hydrolase [Azospirillum griseum]